MENKVTNQKDNLITVASGWVMLPVNLLLLLGSIGTKIGAIVFLANQGSVPLGLCMLFAGIIGVVTSIIMLVGHFTLQPNEGRVQILFGAYKGTVTDSGFHWANPFLSKADTKVSVRTRNFQSEVIKVNDKKGNPIEIAAVVVWRVADLAMAKFAVDDYESYVRIQSESAVRHLASNFAYDHGEDNELTLREGGEEVLAALRGELQERLSTAGVVVDEARITHLAYAQEIAQAMLRRQQAEAIIAARTKIVHGAVSMVDQALTELSEKGVVEFDEDKKATMVSNLLVVLCGEAEVSPVINTGTLYQ
ncbi:MAG: SPFH domain-containing protein [Limisphaerales bacterium]